MKTYKWMEDCIVVDGYLRSCIYDLTRRKTHFVDKNTTALIKKIERISSDEILDELNEDEIEWFNFFIEKEFMFEVPSSQMGYLKGIPLKWTNSSKIMSAVVEYSSHLPKLFQFLNELNCKHVVLQFENVANIKNVMKTHFKKTSLKSLDIIIEHNDNDEDYYNKLLLEYPVLLNIYIKHSTKTIKTSKKNKARRIINISPEATNKLVFSMNSKVFMESQFHNVYLNGKLFIDKEGYFYNTPESPVKLGHINNVNTSKEVLNVSKTKEWDAKKNNTYICEDCELRHMCVDNRTPKWRAIDQKWYYDEECEYNPYIALWKKEKGHVGLNDSGITLSKEGLNIDKTKLFKINEDLWETTS